MDNQRHPFGGDVSTVAEDNDGKRIPNTAGQVYLNKSDLQPVTDLLNEDGSAASLVHTDDKGMVLPFFGPPGAAALYLDFGAGRYEIFATDIPSAAANHIAAGYDEDPHGTLRQARTEMQTYTDRNATNDVNAQTISPWLRVSTDDSGDAWIDVYNQDDEVRWSVKKNGSQLVSPAAGVDGYRAIVSATAKGFSTRTTANGADTAYVTGEGKGYFSKGVQSDGNVTAPNIGDARVYSGPEAPADPKVGDVWVKYGG